MSSKMLRFTIKENIIFHGLLRLFVTMYRKNFVNVQLFPTNIQYAPKGFSLDSILLRS